MKHCPCCDRILSPETDHKLGRLDGLLWFNCACGSTYTMKETIVKKPKYSFEIDLGGEQVRDSGPWLGYDYFTCDGDNFEECLDSGVAFTSDQDGGEGPQFTYADLNQKMQVWIENDIRARIANEIAKTMPSTFHADDSYQDSVYREEEDK